MDHTLDKGKKLWYNIHLRGGGHTPAHRNVAKLWGHAQAGSSPFSHFDIMALRFGTAMHCYKLVEPLARCNPRLA